jgi:hypothetical protein
MAYQYPLRIPEQIAALKERGFSRAADQAK